MDATVIFGCPGSGKTHDLKTRIERLGSEGVNPINMMVLSHTKVAAKEITKRAPQVKASTIHSLAFQSYGYSREQVISEHPMDEFKAWIHMSDKYLDYYMAIYQLAQNLEQDPRGVYHKSFRPGTEREFVYFYGLTSAIATYSFQPPLPSSFQPLPSGLQNTASSKSRAVSPSMVTSGRSRISGVDRRGRPEGKIVEVLEHTLTKVVGRYYEEHGVGFLVAENRRINQDILIPREYAGKAQSAQVVTAEIVAWPTKHSEAIGRNVEVLGDFTGPGMEIEIALRKHDLPHVFPPEIEELAKKLPKKVGKPY